VFTRKQNTDVSYLACAKRLFTACRRDLPEFATHNAHTIGRSIANGGVYEHQKLHGMGDDLYAEVVPADRLGLPCRVYAPVGSHEDLLPYLVRRLLENGANSSFVNRITDERVPIADLIRDPVEMVASFASIPHPRSRCRLTCCAARTTTGRTPWAPTSPTTTNCAPSPRSTRP
jgi:RHH-type proline utilization regulon transcriptional repressor/proline dehydrogenase/delta 1-pyrroline-5-carboxylate dehydrogenase